jgi:aspartokinase-like uncharacterized kinase
MQVIKLGGSLLEGERAKRWLAHLAQRAAAGEPVVVVPGGGPFADHVRRLQHDWGFDHVAAHRMALLAMAQTACVFQSWCAPLRAGHGVAALRRLVDDGHPAIWSPTVMPDTPASWDITSDSLAAWLATALQAERLVLVKSLPAPAGSGPLQWQAEGLVDVAFPRYAQRFGGAIELVAWDAPL